MQAAVTTATAARFGLRVGARLDMGAVQLVITGIIRPVHPASDFWTDDPAAARPSLIQGTSSQPSHWAGAVFVGAGALPVVESSLNADLMLITWVVPAALGRLTADQASALRAGIDGLVSSGLVISSGTAPPRAITRPPGQSNVSSNALPAPAAGLPPVPVMIDSQIPGILTPFVTADRAVAPVLGLLYVGLAIMGAVVVLLGARLVAQHRAAEFTLMRARGAALHQLGWLVLRASAVIAVAAAAAATVLAIGLTPGGGNQRGLVAGWRHDRGDAGRARADQRGPATRGDSGHRQAGEPGQRAEARRPADRDSRRFCSPLRSAGLSCSGSRACPPGTWPCTRARRQCSSPSR